MNNMIEVTGVDLSLFIRTVYALSRPQGMGFLNFQEGDIDQATLDALLNNNYPNIALAMDYVHGRACKMVVFKEPDGTLWINKTWYDHSDEQLKSLLVACGLDVD